MQYLYTNAIFIKKTGIMDLQRTEPFAGWTLSVTFLLRQKPQKARNRPIYLFAFVPKRERPESLKRLRVGPFRWY